MKKKKRKIKRKKKKWVESDYKEGLQTVHVIDKCSTFFLLPSRLVFLLACYATLHPALSVRPSVKTSVKTRLFPLNAFTA